MTIRQMWEADIVAGATLFLVCAGIAVFAWFGRNRV